MQKINFYLESRLAAVKKRAAQNAAHNPNPDSAYKSALNWQVKYGRPGWRAYDDANQYNADGDLMLYNIADFNPVPIQDISPRTFNYSGYYADSFQCETIRPYIVKIKVKNNIFIAPAVDYSDSDQSTIYFSQGQFAPRDENDPVNQCAIYDCARIADRIAERLGEEARECDAQFQAEQQTEDLKADNVEARKEAHKLIEAIREQRRYSNILTPICELLTDKLRELRASIRRNNARIAALNSNPWLAVD